MDLIPQQLLINGRPLHFFHPRNDDSACGTVSCLTRNLFHLDTMGFKPGDAFLDLGCNIGLVSLVVAALYPRVKVYAFDASLISVTALRYAAAANGLANIQAFHVAVGGEDKKGVRFFSNGKDVSCLVQEGLNSSNPVPDTVVDMVSIDTIFDSPLLGIDKVRLLKGDTEGSEYEIFARLFDHRPDILDRIDRVHLEIHPYSEFGPEELKAKVLARFGDRVCFDT